MATQVAGAKSAKEIVFEWEGKDRAGKVVRGETRASASASSTPARRSSSA